MPVFEVHFHFPVQDLWVDGALLGTRQELTFDGRRAFVQLPAHVNDFGLDQQLAWTYRAITGGTPAPEAVDAGEPAPQRWTSALVSMVRVGVYFPVDVTVPAGSDDPSILTRISELARKEAETARALLKTYLDLASATAGQYWLGTQADVPQITWITRIYDEEGVWVRAGFNEPLVIRSRPAWTVLTEQTHLNLLARTAGKEQPAIAEAFLRDAAYLGMMGKDSAHTLLDAAIACEIKIKAMLLDLASPEQRSLVELAVGKNQQFSQAALALFDAGTMAVVGRSLKADDRELFKAVQALFEARNRIAHRGESPSMEEVRKHVATARSVFAWLDSLAGPAA
ncbi:hypothetical protein ABZX95_49705 [Streptomyces sp. NPDC004232]|uniref:hypothetical protein n=1 Tax=Streptomyces sp. NPDC004232 TaxID=3154454 RepID=UPI0033A9AF6B